MDNIEVKRVVPFREISIEGFSDWSGTGVDECHGSLFPNSTHMLCLFHISKNVNMKCKEYVESHRQDHVMDIWNNIMYSNR